MAMQLYGLVMLLLVAAAPSLAADSHMSCTCDLSDARYQKVGVYCGRDTTPQQSSRKRALSCSKEVNGFIPPGYEFVPDVGFYKLFHTFGNYDRAFARCLEDRAYLAIPDSKAQAEAISAIMKRSPRVGNAFVGINGKGQLFRSIKGVPVSSLGYNQWAPGEPRDIKSRDRCVSINPDGLYSVVHCSDVLPFVCQRDISPLPPSGYKYLPQLGFYKLYMEKRTYEGARNRCLSDGGHLAVFDTQKEAEELLNFYDDGYNLFDDKNFNFWEAYVGLNDNDHEGFFVSETGKPLTSLGYSNWVQTEPNNANPPWGENCVTFHFFGTINDVVCSNKNPFFCEIPLPSK